MGNDNNKCKNIEERLLLSPHSKAYAFSYAHIHPRASKQTPILKKTNKGKSEILILLLTTFLYIYPCGVKFCAILVLIESKRRRQQNDADKAKQQQRRQQQQ